MNRHNTGRGITLSIAATTVFALLSVYTRMLRPLGGLDIFAWRIVWTVPGALLLVGVRGRWPDLTAIARVSLRTPIRALMLLSASAMLGIQLWLFMWAPLHGRLLEVSLGYFLLPLSMVLVGRFYYRERLVPLQWLAVAFAGLGVAHELWVTHAFSWPTMVVALGYPPYFILRRKLGGDSLATFALEVLLLLPVAVTAIALSPGAQAALQRPLLWGALAAGPRRIEYDRIGELSGSEPFVADGIVRHSRLCRAGAARDFLGGVAGRDVIGAADRNLRADLGGRGDYGCA